MKKTPPITDSARSSTNRFIVVGKKETGFFSGIAGPVNLSRPHEITGHGRATPLESNDDSVDTNDAVFHIYWHRRSIAECERAFSRASVPEVAIRTLGISRDGQRGGAARAPARRCPNVTALRVVSAIRHLPGRNDHGSQRLAIRFGCRGAEHRYGSDAIAGVTNSSGWYGWNTDRPRAGDYQHLQRRKPGRSRAGVHTPTRARD